MWKKWLAFSGMLGLIVMLDPTHTPAQPGGKGSRGDSGKGGFGAPPGGGTGAPSGGFGQPGGFGTKTKDGGFGAPTIVTTPGGGPGTPGGGGFSRGPGGGGFGAPSGGGFGAPSGGMGTPGGGPGGGGFSAPGGGPGGGGPGGGRGGADPERSWSMLQRLTNSSGDTVDLSAIPPQTRDWLRSAAEKSGGIALPDSGIMTKAMYLDHHARNETARASASGSNGPGGPGGDRGRGPGNFDPNGGFGGGGFGGGGGGWDQRNFEKKETEEEKPIAMRYGKLPKDLPEWFDKDDSDKDGQIGLYEWRAARRDMVEFTSMDLNGDGFVTADEYLRFKRQSTIDTKIANYEETGTRPTNWGIGAPAPGTGETKGKGGPGSWGGFTKGGDTSKTGDTSKPEREKKDKEKGNPWSKGKN